MAEPLPAAGATLETSDGSMASSKLKPQKKKNRQSVMPITPSGRHMSRHCANNKIEMAAKNMRICKFFLDDRIIIGTINTIETNSAGT